MTTDTLTDTESALRRALLDTLIDYLLRIHVDAKALTDTAWEYLQAAPQAHPAMAEVLREAAERLET